MRGVGRGIILLVRLLECSGCFAYPCWIKRALVNNRAFKFDIGVKVQKVRKSRERHVPVRFVRFSAKHFYSYYNVHLEKVDI